MKAEITDALWLDERIEFSVTELVSCSGLSHTELQHLIDCEALLPVAGVEALADISRSQARFSAACLTLARAASRLRDDFELDENGLAMTWRLLHRIRELEKEVSELRAQLPRMTR